jgi:hypothetical protein
MEPQTHPDPLVTLELTASEANAVVVAVAEALRNAIESPPISEPVSTTTPGDLFRLGAAWASVGRLVNVNEQLEWTAHYADADGRQHVPGSVTVKQGVLIEIVEALYEQARQKRYGDDYPELQFDFIGAAATVARAFADQDQAVAA